MGPAALPRMEDLGQLGGGWPACGWSQMLRTVSHEGRWLISATIAAVFDPQQRQRGQAVTAGLRLPGLSANQPRAGGDDSPAVGGR